MAKRIPVQCMRGPDPTSDSWRTTVTPRSLPAPFRGGSIQEDAIGGHSGTFIRRTQGGCAAAKELRKMPRIFGHPPSILVTRSLIGSESIVICSWTKRYILCPPYTAVPFPFVPFLGHYTGHYTRRTCSFFCWRCTMAPTALSLTLPVVPHRFALLTKHCTPAASWSLDSYALPSPEPP